ncbi:hypothetical protein QQ045_020003 [Rhodiola kirilowii]
MPYETLSKHLFHCNLYLPFLTRTGVNSRLQKIPADIRKKISMLHIGAVKILVKAQFRDGIDTPIKMALIDNRIINRKDCILGVAKGNLAFGKFMFTVYPKYGVSLNTKNLDQVLSLAHEFERSDLMHKGDKTNSKKSEVQSEPSLDDMVNLSLREVDDNVRESTIRIENLIEATSAKNIKEISDEIRRGESSKKLLKETNKQIVLNEDKEVATASGLHKYPYPNVRVELVQLMALEEDELSIKFQSKDLCVKYNYNIKENVMVNQEEFDSDEPDIEMGNLGTMKEEAESSATAARRHRPRQRPFATNPGNTIPERNIPAGTINIDGINNMDERKEMIDRWATGISLTVQSNIDNYQTGDTVLLLVT